MNILDENKIKKINKKIKSDAIIIKDLKNIIITDENIDLISEFNNEKKLELDTIEETKNEKNIIENTDSQTTEISKEDLYKIRAMKLERLMSIKYPQQCSEEWFKLRENKITASDSGSVLGVSTYEATYKFISKKIDNPSFTGNKYTYHGKKYEKIATMIYEDREDVIVHDFGLIEHPKYYFLGASPDGIVGKFKKDGITPTDKIGRMLEIKCPVTREIVKEGKIYGEICPAHYWTQVEQQLECCDLDECDFWQCNISEYDDYKAYIEDTGENIYFSKETSFEKGCLIQILPKNKMKEIDEQYNNSVYSFAKFIYPKTLKMNFDDIKFWIGEETIKLNNEYYVDRIIFWRLNNSHCQLILRDQIWFDENLKNMKKIWKYVELLRKKSILRKFYFDYINNLNIKKNNKIMDFVRRLYNTKKMEEKEKKEEYYSFNKEIFDLKDKKVNIKKNDYEEYLF
jgi:putative phage-type endonuclease